MDPEKVASLLDCPIPQSAKEVQSFLGFAKFYRKFIASYSTVAFPLTSLSRKGGKFEWTPAAETAFQALKAAFTTAPVLRHFLLGADAKDVSSKLVAMCTPARGWRNAG